MGDWKCMGRARLADRVVSVEHPGMSTNVRNAPRAARLSSSFIADSIRRQRKKRAQPDQNRVAGMAWHKAIVHGMAQRCQSGTRLPVKSFQKKSKKKKKKDSRFTSHSRCLKSGCPSLFLRRHFVQLINLASATTGYTEKTFRQFDDMRL
jgi:hypothetical protein